MPDTPPRLVVLDGQTLNPGDLSWQPLEALVELTVHARTPADECVSRAEAAELLLTNKVALGAAEFDRLPRLRYIGVTATGYNVVDVAAAAARGITVTNVPAYSTESVAQTVFAHLLNLTHQVARHNDAVHAGRWTHAPDFCFWESPLVELHGQTMGIVGLGQIGLATARLASAFGMRVIATTRTDRQHAGIELVDLDTLFREGDVISLHCPLTPQTQHLVNARRLALMKADSFLINTGRGPLIDEAALADALRAGRLAAAAVDVLSTEPPTADNPLLHAPNCVITPHYGWATKAARQRLMDTVTANIADFLAGHPRNVVS